MEAIVGALNAIDEPELSATMRLPFDFMPASELANHFAGVGFENVEVRRREHEIVFDRGIHHAIEAAYAAPIGPQLRSLPEEKQLSFRIVMASALAEISADGKTMGAMSANVLVARKPLVVRTQKCR